MTSPYYENVAKNIQLPTIFFGKLHFLYQIKHKNVQQLTKSGLESGKLASIA
jgi:hypothetical protein